MTELLHKRQMIERGLLTSWSRRGRNSWRRDNHRALCGLLRVALWLTRLRRRGERNALSPIVRPLLLTYDNLPEGFCGFTILHLTDLHADGLMGLADAISACISGYKVDLCVLTGDYRYETDGSCQGVYPPMQRILKSIQARLGVVGILGNHDVSEEVSALEHLGVRMLINQALELRHGQESAWIIGVDDPHYYGCDDLPEALRDVPSDAFKILLVHTPEIIREAEEYGIDLYLCGHTHGGQICFPFLGPLLINANCPRAYARGVWKYKTLQGYTSPGVGTSGIPVRFLCPPEIGLIELRCTRHATGVGTSTHHGFPRAEETGEILCSVQLTGVH